MTAIITCHSGMGSMGEAMQSALTIKCPSRAVADQLAAAIQEVLSREGDWLVDVHEPKPFTDLPTLTPDSNGEVTDPLNGQKYKVEPGQVALDLLTLLRDELGIGEDE